VAEDYFSDPTTLALCHAIADQDRDRVRELIDNGADVNVVGKAGVTPLLWAIPLDDPEILKLLLKHEADPNQLVTTRVGKGDPNTTGRSATILAGTHCSFESFRLVMTHGGDANARQKYLDRTILHVLIGHFAVKDRSKKIRFLVTQCQPDLDILSGMDCTPVMEAVGRGLFETALLLLDSGADPHIYRPRSNQRLIHFVARVVQQEQRASWSDERERDYKELVTRLNALGYSVEDAADDLKRWEERGRMYPPAKVRELREQEIAERKLRES